jgi:hypothetical protein
MGSENPSVHRLDDGRLLIVGQYNPARARMVGASMGEDETAIVIDPGLLEEFLRCQAGESADADRAVVNEAPDGSSPFGLPSLSQEIGRVGSWAPGQYLGKCDNCKREFEGDKRSRHCLPCAIKATQESLKVYSGMYNRIVKAFDDNETAQEFLSEDGDGGFAAGVYRMACAIVYLRSQLAKSERGQSPKGGDFAEGSVHADPVPEGNSPPPNQDFEAKAREIVKDQSWNFPDHGGLTILPEALINLISSALLTASKDATERAARIAENGMLVPPDGGSPTEDECNLALAIASAIRTQES